MSKSGQKPDEFRAILRRMFSDWSDRTFTTYYTAWRRLAYLEELGVITRDERKTLMGKSHRPNGSVNVSKFARISEDVAAMWLASLDDEATR